MRLRLDRLASLSRAAAAHDSMFALVVHLRAGQTFLTLVALVQILGLLT